MMRPPGPIRSRMRLRRICRTTIRGRMGGEIGAGRGEDRGHRAENREPPAPRLGKRRFEHRARQASDLVVHLHGGDPALGARHLEVHVTQVILVPQDVGEDGESSLVTLHLQG